MRCAIYTRVSTDNQVIDGESLDEQEKKLLDYCRLRDWQVVKVYREEGRSGKNLERPKFKKLIKDIENGVIDTIVIKKVDRLSRSILDFEKTYNFFERNKINLVSLQENFDTATAIGRAIIRTVLVFAQLEREQTAERTLDVMEYRAQQGLWNGGYSPLGYDYDKEKGELVVNEKEMKIVRLIFNKYLELGSYQEVAKYVNGLGYKSKEYINRKGERKGGRKFIDTTIGQILKNSIYIGKIRYNGKMYNGKHKAIIDEEIFDQVQNLIEKNRRKNSNIKKVGKHNFILEGLVRCGYCGSIMTSKWAVSKGKRYFYYECTSVEHSGKEACQVRQISASALEEIIIERIEQISQNDILLHGILWNANRKAEEEIKELEAGKLVLKLRLAELNKRGSKLVRKFADSEDKAGDKLILREMKKIEEEIDKLEKEIGGKDFKIGQLQNYVINAQLVRDTFRYFSKVYEKIDEVEKKNLMQLLIKEIEFTREKIRIEFFEIPEVEVIIKRASTNSFAEALSRLPAKNKILTSISH